MKKARLVVCDQCGKEFDPKWEAVHFDSISDNSLAGYSEVKKYTDQELCANCAAQVAETIFPLGD